MNVRHVRTTNFASNGTGPVQYSANGSYIHHSGCSTGSTMLNAWKTPSIGKQHIGTSDKVQQYHRKMGLIMSIAR